MECQDCGSAVIDQGDELVCSASDCNWVEFKTASEDDYDFVL